ncbi:hypothetical protein WS75_27980 [Burkholderia sp. FL-7-2-10-S1-D7]|nr:hypothetical protein WS75_27980 [Burkholderia sp. FL-7-2-10-S1-D7]
MAPRAVRRAVVEGSSPNWALYALAKCPRWMREQIAEYVRDIAAQPGLRTRCIERIGRRQHAFEQRRELHARALARGDRHIDDAAPQRALVEPDIGSILDLLHQLGIADHADRRHVVGRMEFERRAAARRCGIQSCP